MEEGNGSKMSQNYLRQMEEKIFHIKRDSENTKPNAKNEIESKNLQNKLDRVNSQHKDLARESNSRTKFTIVEASSRTTIQNGEINCRRKYSNTRISQEEMCSCNRENSSLNVCWPGKINSSEFIKSTRINQEASSHSIRKENSSTNKMKSIGSKLNHIQYPDDLLRQLSQHEKFESQQLKYNQQNLNKPSFEEIPLIDLMKADSDKSFQSTSTKRSNSLPRPKLPVNWKNPRTAADLFNPNFNFNKGRELASMGKSLLESIKSRVFGSKGVEKNSNESEDEWTCESKNSVEDSLRFPKETRHAVSNMYDTRSKMCISCSRRFKNVRTVDAQTSPIASGTTLDGSRSNGLTIPCPLNLLCGKGIHLGRCEQKAIEKVREPPVCDLNCTCRTSAILFKDKNMRYPGRAEPDRSIVSSVSKVSVIIGQESSLSESDVELAESATKMKFEEGEDHLANAESKTSMATILKLMEPQFADGTDITLPDTPNSTERTNPPTQPKIMNGMNGHANGDLNGCGDIITQNQQKGCWTIGLINSKFRYLTAETFGFKINANGTSLKKKQIWTLEPENVNGGESMIYLRSHLDKYLAVDSFGNVTCEIDEKEPGCKFQICVSEDGSGRWALKNVVRGYFLGSTSDKLTCTAKVPADAEFWHIHLAARPQVNLRSVGRKRFAHLSENLDEIQVDANIPWGEDTLFTLEFRLEESGKYAIHTCNNKYLSMQGKLVETCNKDCLFSAEYHSGQLALRDRTGTYLSPIGSKAVLKSRSNTVTKDELFSLEDSLPQASFVASLNSRFVSVKQGVDVTANQDEISDHETFQLEFDWSTKRWYIRTMQDKYWTLETGGGIQASGDKRSSNALFELEWQTDGSLAFRANNGRYVITKRSGHLYATAEAIEDNCKYFFYLINRPILVLKCEQGFVGYKAANNPKLECNKATYECIQVERGDKGIVHFKGQNGKYWHVDSEGVTADSDVQEGFYLELREPTRLCIKSIGGNYITASKNGMFRLGDTAIENATQWEY